MTPSTFIIPTNPRGKEIIIYHIGYFFLLKGFAPATIVIATVIPVIIVILAIVILVVIIVVCILLVKTKQIGKL